MLLPIVFVLLLHEREAELLMGLIKERRWYLDPQVASVCFLNSLKTRTVVESVVLVQVSSYSFSLESSSRSMLRQLFVASVYPAIDESRYVTNPLRIWGNAM